MRRLTGVGLIVLAVLVGACSSSSNESSSTTSTTAAASQASSSGCITVSPAAKDRLGVPATGATKAPDGQQGRKRWYYSTADGATWVSGADPVTGEADDLMLPLNAKARATSDAGVDVPTGAPAFSGAADSDPAAVQSRSCAHS